LLLHLSRSPFIPHSEEPSPTYTCCICSRVVVQLLLQCNGTACQQSIVTVNKANYLHQTRSLIKLANFFSRENSKGVSFPPNTASSEGAHPTLIKNMVFFILPPFQYLVYVNRHMSWFSQAASL